jgi:hypothetical protein
MAMVIALASGSRCSPPMKERSIFRRSMGKRRRYARDE